jgi:hypothetical protein
MTTDTMTYRKAHAEGVLAGNQHMTAAGRTTWNVDDYNVACATERQLWWEPQAQREAGAQTPVHVATAPSPAPAGGEPPMTLWVKTYADALKTQADVEYLDLHAHNGGPCTCTYVFPCFVCHDYVRVEGEGLVASAGYHADCPKQQPLGI